MTLSERKKLLPIFALLLAGLVIALYSRTIHDPVFLWDDRYLMEQNAFIKDAENIPNLFTKEYFTQVYELSWRPAGTFSMILDYAVHKDNAAGFRLTNIGLHAVNAILLCLFLVALFSFHGQSRFSVWGCLGVAALFAAHPVNTEAVNGITFREDLLCLLFVLLSGIAYLRDRKRGGSAFIASFLFIPALLSKETAVVFPAVLLLLEFTLLREKNDPQSETRAVFARNLPYAFWTVLFLILRFGPMKGPAEQLVFHGGGPFDTFLLSCGAWRKYLQLVFYPVSQCFDYFQSGVPSLSDPLYLLSLMGFLAVIASPFVLLKRNRAASFGIAWYILFLLPVSNILPIGVTMAERYLYLPLAGAAVAIAALMPAPGRPANHLMRGVFAFIFAIVFASLCVLTFERNRVWDNEIGFWRQTASCSPHPGQPLVNLGLAYDRAGRVDEAAAALSHAADIAESSDPESDRYGTLYRAYGNLGMTLARAGRFEEAVTPLLRALELHPGYVHAEKNLMIMASRCERLARGAEMVGDTETALKYYRILLRIYPGDADLTNKIRKIQLPGPK
jgi:tetratricopeptide (TPR) repeat protein